MIAIIGTPSNHPFITVVGLWANQRAIWVSCYSELIMTHNEGSIKEHGNFLTPPILLSSNLRGWHFPPDMIFINYDNPFAKTDDSLWWKTFNQSLISELKKFRYLFVGLCRLIVNRIGIIVCGYRLYHPFQLNVDKRPNSLIAWVDGSSIMQINDSILLLQWWANGTTTTWLTSEHFSHCHHAGP